MGGARCGVDTARAVQFRPHPTSFPGAISPGRTSYYTLDVAGRLRGQRE
nr:MAG TPA: hypothetical protein [Caudoviricetes sp.]